MGRKRELTKARLIRDLNIGQSIEIGVLFSLIGIGAVGIMIWKFNTMVSTLKMITPILGMFALSFCLLGGFMLYVALKDRHSVVKGTFHIFKDTVQRIEDMEGSKYKRVYFEEYTKLRGFGAVNLPIAKIAAGDKYFLIKLPSSNFVALAYPCSAYDVGEETKIFLGKASAAFENC